MVRTLPAGFTSTPPGSPPVHHGCSRGASAALRRINFGANTRVMGIFRIRGSMLPWWKACHRSRGPWDRTGPTRWPERPSRFPKTKRYRADTFLLLEPRAFNLSCWWSFLCCGCGWKNPKLKLNTLHFVAGNYKWVLVQIVIWNHICWFYIPGISASWISLSKLPL